MKLLIFCLFSNHIFANLEMIFLYQGSIITPNNAQKEDFMSSNSELIWGILIGIFVLGSIAYLVYAAKKKKQREEEQEAVE